MKIPDQVNMMYFVIKEPKGNDENKTSRLLSTSDKINT